MIPTEDNAEAASAQEQEEDLEFFGTAEESKDADDDNSTMKQAIIERLKKEMSDAKAEAGDADD